MIKEKDLTYLYRKLEDDYVSDLRYLDQLATYLEHPEEFEQDSLDSYKEKYEIYDRYTNSLQKVLKELRFMTDMVKHNK